MTTVRVVAREAGVSAMTVSNVINGHDDRVSAATAERVRAVMDRLGFAPHASARALSSKRSDVIALVYTDEGGQHSALDNPHFSSFIGEVERQVSRSGRHLMIRSAENVKEAAKQVMAWRVDGMIVLGTIASEVEAMLEHYSMPIVFVDNYSQSADVTTVGIDDFKGGYLAARHLVEAGHRRIALVGPQAEGEGVLYERYRGFMHALAGNGAHGVEAVPLTCTPHFDEGFSLAAKLARSANRPTGVFAAADIIALGLLKGFLVSGLRVPGDVSLVGFDGLRETAYVLPSITTVSQDVPAKAQAAVRSLIASIDAGSEGAAQKIRLDVELIARDTVGPPPEAVATAGARGVRLMGERSGRGVDTGATASV